MTISIDDVIRIRSLEGTYTVHKVDWDKKTIEVTERKRGAKGKSKTFPFSNILEISKPSGVREVI